MAGSVVGLHRLGPTGRRLVTSVSSFYVQEASRSTDHDDILKLGWSCSCANFRKFYQGPSAETLLIVAAGPLGRCPLVLLGIAS